MSDNEKRLEEIVDLQEIIITNLIESLDRVIDCEKLSCYKLIEQVKVLRDQQIEAKKSQS